MALPRIYTDNNEEGPENTDPPAMRSLEVVHTFENGFLRPSTYVDAVFLPAGVPVEHPVPTSTDSPVAYAIFSATGNFYASYGRGAVMLVNATIDGGMASELNPHLRFIKDQPFIGLIAPVNTTVTIAWFKP